MVFHNALSLRQSACWPLAAACILFAATSACWAQQEITTSFVTGKPVGPLQIARENADFEKEGKQFHLSIHPGGCIKFIFDTTGRRGEVFLEFVGRTQKPVLYELELNDETIERDVNFHFDVYTSIGHDLSRKIIKGKNVAVLHVLDTSQGSLWLQKVTVTVGEGGWNPWVALAFWSLLSVVLGRYVLFPLFWRNGRGMDPIWATRISLVIIILGIFVAYLYFFGGSFGLIISAAVGAGGLAVLMLLLTFTRT